MNVRAVGYLVVTGFLLVSYQNCGKQMEFVSSASMSQKQGADDLVSIQPVSPRDEEEQDVPSEQMPPEQRPPVDRPEDKKDEDKKDCDDKKREEAAAGPKVKKCVKAADLQVQKKDGVEMLACPSNRAEKCALLCHVPPGNPSARHTIIVGLPGAKNHMKQHDDVMGACAEVQPNDVVCEDDAN